MGAPLPKPDQYGCATLPPFAGPLLQEIHTLHRTRLLALPVAALVSFSLAACGGDDGGEDNGEDPQAVLERVFNNDEEVQSGTFELSFNVDAEGDQSGSLETSLGGPFQSREGDLPAFDIEGSAKAETPGQDFDF